MPKMFDNRLKLGYKKCKIKTVKSISYNCYNVTLVLQIFFLKFWTIYLRVLNVYEYKGKSEI